MTRQDTRLELLQKQLLEALVANDQETVSRLQRQIAARAGKEVQERSE